MILYFNLTYKIEAIEFYQKQEAIEIQINIIKKSLKFGKKLMFTIGKKIIHSINS